MQNERSELEIVERERERQHYQMYRILNATKKKKKKETRLCYVGVRVNTKYHWMLIISNIYIDNISQIILII